MAVSSLLRSTVSSPLIEASHADLAAFFKVSSVGFSRNLNYPKVQSSIFGNSIPSKSSSLQICKVRSVQPIKATTIELSPTVQSKSVQPIKATTTKLSAIV
ncbi:hypothetical protein C1H46_034422 [Malus baccata]|uniref:Uncharacterized protein n=1 Tax=Malus baccata TaxID=106549 RepID=A0A540L149_MALBA|nr:hypothetical protein C1H46_034422 [Malus baccata]